MTDSTTLARAVIAAVLEAGAREVVLSPGSRSAPLAFALHDAEEAGSLRLHTRVDERSAGFLALGMAKATGRPAAVVCTSGTAVANLQPAVLEARHAGVRLVVLAADRPARMRGTSANQTTDQVGLLTGADVLDLDAASWPELAGRVDELLLGPPGPVHLNVQLEEPLTPRDRWRPQVRDVAPPALPRTAEAVVAPRGPRTVVLAGDDAGPPARILAERAGWPLLAEPTSGARTGSHALRCYRLLLDGDLGRQVERVVVHGHPTLSRPVTRLLAREDVEIWDVDPLGQWQERPFGVDRRVPAATVDTADAAPGQGETDTDWLARWLAADASVSRRLDALLAGEEGVTPHEAAGAVARALPEGGLLFVGASSPIRDLDLMVPRYRVGARRKVLANRGLAGIDGVVSSAVGAALARSAGEGQSSSRNLALLGDVTFLHDAGGLVLGPAEPRPDLTLVVVNDDGGSIFTMLEQGASEYADRFDRLFGTPHGVDLASWCAATRTPHWRVESLPELEHALAQPAGGIEVVEVRVRRHDRRDLDARIRALLPD